MDLADSLARIVALAHDGYSEWDLLAPGGEIALEQTVQGVTRLRLELPSGAPLHLQSISVDAPGVTDLAELVHVRASSWYGDLESRFEVRRLLDWAHPSGPAVHTAGDEDCSWVELEFSRPIDVQRVRLRNVTGTHAPRVHGLRVHATSGDGARTTVLDLVARQEQLTRAALAVADSDEDSTAFAPILAATIAGDYGPARVDYKALSMPERQRRVFRQIVSDDVLRTRSLEWTMHGLQRTFRFWSLEEKQHYLRFTAEVVEDLGSLTKNACFGFGAALSVVRDGDLIPHDDDLDIIVGFEREDAATMAEAKDLLEAHLRAAGYGVSGKHFSHRWVEKPGIPKAIDVFVGLFEGERISWYPGKRGVLTRAMMFPPSHRTILGVEVPVPREPENYLEQIYGPTWQTPDPTFEHQWTPAAYKDLNRAPGVPAAAKPAPATKAAAKKAPAKKSGAGKAGAQAAVAKRGQRSPVMRWLRRRAGRVLRPLLARRRRAARTATERKASA